MASLAKGYVIPPRLVAGKHELSTVCVGHGGGSAHLADRVALAGDLLDDGCDSRQLTRAHYAHIYKTEQNIQMYSILIKIGFVGHLGLIRLIN